MFLQIEQILISLASQTSLEFFALWTSFLEEIITPIPSPSISIMIGFLASVQTYTIWGLILLTVISAFGKTLGALAVYIIVDKVEDVLVGRIGKFIGVTHVEIENLGNKLSNNWKDYILLFVLRTIPIFPSTLISVGAGFLKIRLKLFLLTTFFGSIIRNFLYIYLGYFSIEMARLWIDKIEFSKNIIYLLFGFSFTGLIIYLLYRRTKNKVN
jgi:membrane protein DedA with SNARE-associated domain